MKIFLLIFLFLELDARSFFIVGEYHGSSLAKSTEKTLRDCQNDNKIKYFRENPPTKLNTGDVYMEDPHVQLYMQMTDAMDALQNHEGVYTRPYYIFLTLNSYQKYLEPELLGKIKKLFGENFENIDFDMTRSADFLERLKKFHVPLEKTKQLLRTYIIEVLEKKFQVKCDWNEFCLMTFRNHAWLSNLEPHLKDENGKYVIQMGRNHVEYFISILKEKYPKAEIETCELENDAYQNRTGFTVAGWHEFYGKQQLIDLSKTKFEFLFRSFLDGKKK